LLKNSIDNTAHIFTTRRPKQTTMIIFGSSPDWLETLLLKQPFHGLADFRFSTRPAPFGKKQPTKSFFKTCKQ
jgi:hypothetical protein